MDIRSTEAIEHEITITEGRGRCRILFHDQAPIAVEVTDIHVGAGTKEAMELVRQFCIDQRAELVIGREGWESVEPLHLNAFNTKLRYGVRFAAMGGGL